MQAMDKLLAKGLFTTQMAYEAGITKYSLKKAVNQGVITSKARGVFANPEMPYDIYALVALIYPSGIFAKMSALTLYDMTDELPKHLDMAFPYGYNNKTLPQYQIKPFRQKPELLKLGVTEVTTTSGAIVKAYSPARTLLDIWDDPAIDSAVRLDAMKVYMQRYNSSKTEWEMMRLQNALYPNSTISSALEVLIS